MFEVTKKDINDALDRIKVSLTDVPITEEILNMYVKQATSQTFDLAQNMAFIRDVKKYGKFNSEFTIYKSSAKSSAKSYIAQILGFTNQYSSLIHKAKKIYAGHAALSYLSLSPEYHSSPEKVFGAVEYAGTFLEIPIYRCNIISFDTREIYFELNDSVEIVKLKEC